VIFLCKNHSEVPRASVKWNGAREPVCPWCGRVLDTEPMPLSIALKSGELAGPFTTIGRVDFSDPEAARARAACYRQQEAAAAAMWPAMLEGMMKRAREPGRTLTVPSSIDSGLGPECAGKV
jgi:hypothetical protein